MSKHNRQQREETEPTEVLERRLEEATKLLRETLRFGGRVGGGEGHPHDVKIRRFLNEATSSLDGEGR